MITNRISGTDSFARRAVLGVAALSLGWLTPVAVQGQQTCRAEGQLMSVRDLPEASGVAVSRKSPGVLWSHNDSGEPVLVAVSTDGGARGRVRIAGARVEDWEDIDVGPCPQGSCVYIADIGDNSGKRTSVTIYRVPEPDPDATTSAAAEAMRVSYPDRPQDAEALIVNQDGSILIVTKGEQGPAALYKAPAFRNGATTKLERVATIAEVNGNKGVSRNDRITGAAASRDGRWIALRSISAVTFYSASDFEAGKVRESFRFDVKSIGEQQGEGVAFGDGGTVWLSSEGGGKSRPGTIARLSCSLN